MIHFDPATRTLHFKTTVGLKGFIKLETATPLDPVNDPYGKKGIVPGSRRVVADWFPNKVLDAGRNRMGTASDWLNYAQVGTGSTAPLAIDTALEQWVAGTSQLVIEQHGARSTAPHYGWKRITRRFPVGDATGNLQEGGMGWGSSGAAIYCRALIVDGNGDPTTATVLANEFLDLTYEIRYYPPLVDVTGVLTMDQEDYNTIIRAAAVTSSDAWGDLIGDVVEAIHINSTPHLWLGYDDILGDITEYPDGATAAFSGTITNIAYSNNSYERKFEMDGNESAFVFDPVGVRSIKICTRAGHYQMQFSRQSDSAPLQKSGSHIMNLKFTIAWEETSAP